MLQTPRLRGMPSRPHHIPCRVDTIAFIEQQQFRGYNSCMRMRADGLGHFGQKLRRRLRVVVEQHDYPPPAPLASRVDTGNEAPFFASGKYTSQGRIGLHPGHGVVAAGIVDKDHFEIGEGLRGQPCKQIGQVAAAVIVGNDHREERRRAGDSFTPAVLSNSSPAIIALLISFIEISLREFRQRLAPVAQFDTQGRAGLVDQNGGAVAALPGAAIRARRQV